MYDYDFVITDPYVYYTPYLSPYYVSPGVDRPALPGCRRVLKVIPAVRAVVISEKA